MPVPSKSELARASLLAAELIDLCYAAGKPLAADFVQGGIDLYMEGTGFEPLADRWPHPKASRFDEN